MVNAYRPSTIDEALRIRNETKALPLAGGTDLMVRYKNWAGLPPKFSQPVMFVAHLHELKGIEVEGDELIIRSATTLTELLKDGRVPEVLKLAVKEMASPLVRNIATIGGNICNASPAGDTLPPLYALDAKVVLRSVEGERTVPIEDFITGPGQTVLKENEILCEIRIPMDEFDSIFYRKVGTRRANALSKVSFVGLKNLQGDRIDDIRIAFGAVAPTVVRSRDAEKMLKGIKIDEIEQIYPSIEAKYAELIRPIDDQRSTAEYRKIVSLRLLRFFLLGKAD
ncbi:MAG: hypothetical protein DRQ10_02065 [Candidatus Hydrothermota bacterium]|nr:MAG: hypothetical protein DRQ10_02065 [Candidatus Hydrothermae bacterium]